MNTSCKVVDIGKWARHIHLQVVEHRILRLKNTSLASIKMPNRFISIVRVGLKHFGISVSGVRHLRFLGRLENRVWQSIFRKALFILVWYFDVMKVTESHQTSARMIFFNRRLFVGPFDVFPSIGVLTFEKVWCFVTVKAHLKYSVFGFLGLLGLKVDWHL